MKYFVFAIFFLSINVFGFEIEVSSTYFSSTSSYDLPNNDLTTAGNLSAQILNSNSLIYDSSINNFCILNVSNINNISCSAYSQDPNNSVLLSYNLNLSYIKQEDITVSVKTKKTLSQYQEEFIYLKIGDVVLKDESSSIDITNPVTLINNSFNYNNLTSSKTDTVPVEFAFPVRGANAVSRGNVIQLFVEVDSI